MSARKPYLWLSFAILTLLSLCPSGVRAQGSKYEGSVTKSVTGGLFPGAAATITVCATSSTIVGGVCVTPENDANCCFTDATLTVHIPQGNPFPADALGNYFFWAVPGSYQVSISGSGITASTKTVVVGCVPGGTGCAAGGGGTPGGTNLQGQFNNTGNFGGTSCYNLGTLTGPLNFDCDTHPKGPNPSYDITRYGGYEYTGTAQTTTGTMSGSSSALTLASAIDFANGQGILVLGAGPATSLGTPVGVTVSQQNVTGSTTYTYCVVAEDYANGRTACSAAASTSTGAANLGTFTAGTISGCTRTGGIVSCTTTAAHHLSAGSFIELSGTGVFNYNGTATLLTGSGTTFTYPQIGLLDDAVGISAGTVKALALNVVQWTEVDYTVLRSYVYRCTTTCALPANAANYSLAGVTQGMDGGFLDYGYAVSTTFVGNGDVSATAPTAATTQWLPTRIVSGGGTVNLTLAAAATNAVSGVTVAHDNTPIFPIVCSAMNTATTGGGIILIPNGNGNTTGAAFFPINSTLNLGTACPSQDGGSQLQIDFAATVIANGSVIPRSLMKLNGISNLGHGANFYHLEPVSLWEGNAYPFIYALPGTSSNWSMYNFIAPAFRAYQACVVQDQDENASNVVSIKYHNVHLASILAPAYILGGGFGFFWEYGGWAVSGGTSFASPPAVWNKVNYGLGKPSNSQLAGIFYADHTYMFGGYLADAGGQNPLTSVGVSIHFKDTLAESSYGPMFRFRLAGNTLDGVIDTPSYADFLGGGATPLIDVVSASIVGLNVIHPGCGSATQPVFQAQNSANSYLGVVVPIAFGAGCAGVGLPAYTSGNFFFNTQISTSGANGDVFYLMPTPGAPVSAIVSAGGSVPVGVHSYSVSAVDVNGLQTVIGPALNATTTTGNQTVTVTPPTLPSGAVGWIAYRDTVQVPCFATAGNGAFVDTVASGCGQSSPATTLAGLASLSSHGLSGYQVVLTNQFGDTLAALPLTANRTQNFPDVSGTVQVPGGPNAIALTADWTCGTGGTVATCTSATIIGSGGGVPLTFTLPLVAQSYTLECDGVVGQATAATANNWNLLTATNGATNVTAFYDMYTAATAKAGGATTDTASTTTTFNIGPTWTLGGTATKMPFHVNARIEGTSASGTVVSLQLVAPTVGDLVTIYRGASCKIF